MSKKAENQKSEIVPEDDERWRCDTAATYVVDVPEAPWKDFYGTGTPHSRSMTHEPDGTPHSRRMTDPAVVENHEADGTPQSRSMTNPSGFANHEETLQIIDSLTFSECDILATISS